MKRIDIREELAFEFYRFSYPNLWEEKRDDMWDRFQACRGSNKWFDCIRSADAIISRFALSRS